jgi:peptidoglycan/LPS O-acetylase OafA/YrhL
MNDTMNPQEEAGQDAVERIPGPPASVTRAVLNQRRALMLAAILIIGAFWVTFGEWTKGALIAAGVALGAVNHIMTEYAIQKAIAAEDAVTRNAYARSSLLRLAVISLAAFALTVVFWDQGGVGVLFGLAIFHLIALALTAIPLLREVRNS